VAPAPATPEAVPEFDDVTELFVAHVTDPGRELLVREGDHVRRGQILARLTWKDPELERQRLRAEGERLERERVASLRSDALRQAHALVAAGLASPGTAGRVEADLLTAQEAVAQARRELERLAEETDRATAIRAPVDGQVLTLRVHVVHGSEGTARLRLLYRRPAKTPTFVDPKQTTRESSKLTPR
jgi:multidrug efflux pump subunit AcrA (membrane-fusion protein)